MHDFMEDKSVNRVIDNTDFSNEYVENGGSKDLMCYIKYFDGDMDISMSALEVLSHQNLIENSTKVKRKVFK